MYGYYFLKGLTSQIHTLKWNKLLETHLTCKYTTLINVV